MAVNVYEYVNAEVFPAPREGRVPPRPRHRPAAVGRLVSASESQTIPIATAIPIPKPIPASTTTTQVVPGSRRDHGRHALQIFVGSLVASVVGDRTGNGLAAGTHAGGIGNVLSKLRPGCSSEIGGAFNVGGQRSTKLATRLATKSTPSSIFAPSSTPLCHSPSALVPSHAHNRTHNRNRARLPVREVELWSALRDRRGIPDGTWCSGSRADGAG